MSRFPSMPLFAGDMLADTEHLTNEEFAVYHRLLYAMWRRNGWVPDDDVDLARICHVGTRAWHRLKPRMMQFLVRNEAGELSQKKLLKVRKFVEQKRTAQSKIARKRWHPDSKENNEMADAKAYANSMPNARATPNPNNNLFDVAPSFHAKPNGNGSAPAADGSLGLEGRSPQPPIAKGGAPPPDKPWPPPSKLLEQVYPNGKTHKSGNGTQRGGNRGHSRKAARPRRAAKDNAGAQEGAETENPDRG
jgi:uncharacterized protein YdaU (DUF1376 family)